MSETVEQIKSRKYECFIEDHEPLPWTPGQCAGYSGRGSLALHLFRCKRRSGHGPEGLFCKQHADRWGRRRVSEIEMIERVARALKAEFSDPIARWNKAAGLPSKFPAWESDSHIWMRQARAAIAAMREPSEAMIDAGEPIVYGCYSSEPGEGLDKNPAVPTWHAMIDAALISERGAEE